MRYEGVNPAVEAESNASGKSLGAIALYPECLAEVIAVEVDRPNGEIVAVDHLGLHGIESLDQVLGIGRRVEKRIGGSLPGDRQADAGDEFRRSLAPRIQKLLDLRRGSDAHDLAHREAPLAAQRY